MKAADNGESSEPVMNSSQSSSVRADAQTSVNRDNDILSAVIGCEFK